ncbi:MAG: branched-chain amino acid ABC transporter permease [Paracoccaceae bacterium]
MDKRLILPVLCLIPALFVPQILEAIGEGFLIGLATRIVIYGIAAMSLNFILGYGGMVSFGHAAYFGVGAYMVAILSHHAFEETTIFGLPGTDFAPMSFLVAIIVSAFAALVIGALSLRTTGVYFIMITLAFAQMLFFLFVALEHYGGDDGLLMFSGRNILPGVDLSDDTTFYYVSIAVLVVVVALFSRLVRSRFGMVLEACRQNEPRMRTLGYPVYRYKLTAFVIAGAIAGLAGALHANQLEFISPDSLHWTRSGDLMIMVILGGIGRLYGPILGAALFLLLEEFLPVIFHELHLPTLQEHWRIVFGPMLILFVFYAKDGLAGLFSTRKEGEAT